MTSGVLSENATEKLKNAKIFIAGCGGLGGFVIDGLARTGANNLTLCDGDTFDESNLNRQIFCDRSGIGRGKAAYTAEKLPERERYIDIRVTVLDARLNEDNAERLIGDADIVFDCVDNIRTKLLLESVCLDKGIPLIHGGVERWSGQAGIIFKPTLKKLYAGRANEGRKNIYFTVANIASLQLALYAAYLEGDTADKLLAVDLRTGDVVRLGS